MKETCIVKCGSVELRGLAEQRHIKAVPIMSGVPNSLEGAQLTVRGVEGRVKNPG